MSIIGSMYKNTSDGVNGEYVIELNIKNVIQDVKNIIESTSASI